jgi:hypothetical protein
VDNIRNKHSWSIPRGSCTGRCGPGLVVGSRCGTLLKAIFGWAKRESSTGAFIDDDEHTDTASHFADPFPKKKSKVKHKYGSNKKLIILYTTTCCSSRDFSFVVRVLHPAPSLALSAAVKRKAAAAKKSSLGNPLGNPVASASADIYHDDAALHIFSLHRDSEQLRNLCSEIKLCRGKQGMDKCSDSRSQSV